MESTKVTYEVSLTFTDLDGTDPLSVVKEVSRWIQEDADNMIYDVTNEITKEHWTVDLSEDDEDAVLPNNDDRVFNG